MRIFMWILINAFLWMALAFKMFDNAAHELNMGKKTFPQAVQECTEKIKPIIFVWILSTIAGIIYYIIVF